MINPSFFFIRIIFLHYNSFLVSLENFHTTFLHKTRLPNNLSIMNKLHILMPNYNCQA